MNAYLRIAGLIALAICASSTAQADNFVRAQYDGETDALVVTIRYRGTNPDHGFTTRWGRCKPAVSGQGYQLSAVVLDDQWKDAAQSSFTKTTRFSLAAVACRPAHVTLHIAPHFYYRVDIPASPGSSR